MGIQIGRIVAALEKSGKARNTYVIMTADHGLAVGEHGLPGEQNLYDCSVRIPLIVAGPGSPGRQACRRHGLSAQHVRDNLGIVRSEDARARGIPQPRSQFGYYKHFQRMVRTSLKKLQHELGDDVELRV